MNYDIPLNLNLTNFYHCSTVFNIILRVLISKQLHFYLIHYYYYYEKLKFCD